MIRERHDCASCPKNTEPHSDNPNACQYADTTGMPERRKKVIWIVHKMMHNNPHPWCQFEYGFRFMIVQSAVLALEHQEAIARNEARVEAAKAGLAVLPAEAERPRMQPHHVIRPRQTATAQSA